MVSIVRRVCDRCGEEFYKEDKDIFKVSYETLGSTKDGSEHKWVTLDLCRECQRELRVEFYKRGVIKDDV